MNDGDFKFQFEINGKPASSNSLHLCVREYTVAWHVIDYLGSYDVKCELCDATNRPLLKRSVTITVN